MGIHHFYSPEKLPAGGDVTLTASETAHAIKVLRLQPGDDVILLDGQGTVASAVIMPPQGNRRIHEAVCRLKDVQTVPPPAKPVHLYVAPPKSKNMDIVLKAATELGAADITPIFCRYSVSKPETNVKETWEQALITALKQSTNPWLPKLHPAMDFADALKQSGGYGYFGAVPTDADAEIPAPWDRPDGETALWIGPEGGFSTEEEAALRAHGLFPLTVGNWILRVETAVAALLACLNLKR